MKTLFTAATLAAAFALTGCNTTQNTEAAPGATSGDCCGSCDETKAAPGAVSGECASSCSDKAATCPFTGSCSDKG
jgi:hypothetical protein